MLELVNESNSQFFDTLVQDYEAEFSSITGKTKNQEGKYSVDVDWHTPNIGYYWKEASHIVGFCLIEPIDGYFEIVDFYVIPAYRRKKIGKNMAFAVFDTHPGPWQVRQLLGSQSSTTFWKKVIGAYTHETYTELQIDDPRLGRAVCQRFPNQK